MRTPQAIWVTAGGLALLIAGAAAWRALRAPRLPPAAYLAKGFAFHHRQQYSNAITTFEACVRNYPTFADGYDALARSYRDTGALSNALSCHAKAIQLNPHRFEYHWERGVTRLKMKDYDNAILDFEMCIEKNPECANCFNGLGMAYRDKEDFQPAVTHHHRAIQLSPARPDFYWERAVTYRRMGDNAQAEADIAKARQLGFGQ